MIEQETEQATGTQTEVVDNSEVTAMEDVFKRELGVETAPKEEPGNKPDKALEEGLPKEPEKVPEAPIDETPAVLDVEPSDENAPKAADVEADEKPVVDVPEEDNSLLNDYLQIETDDDKSADDWKARNSETRKYADGLNDEIRSYKEALASAGRQLIHTDDGDKLAPTEDAEEFNPESVDGIIKNLTEEELELFVDEPEKAAKLIAERTIKAVADKFTPIQANAQDKMLTRNELDDVYGNFLEEKLSDGTSRFKDADDSKVVGLMKKIVDSSTDPTINRLVEFANKDKDMQHVLLELLHSRVFIGTYKQKLYAAEQKKAQIKTKEKIEKEPSLSASGSAAPTKGQQGQSDRSQQVNDIFASEIAAMSG